MEYLYEIYIKTEKERLKYEKQTLMEVKELLNKHKVEELVLKKRGERE